MIKKSVIMMALVSIYSLAGADVVWNGAFDNQSFFNEGNWQDTATGLAPADGTINGSVALNGGVVENYILGGKRLTNVGGGNVILGNALTTLTLRNGAALHINNSKGFVGAGTLNITGGSEAKGQYILTDLVVNIDGTSFITLLGGGTPINTGATISLEGGAMINLTDETVAAATSEHFGKIFIGGTALSSLTAGVDYTIVSDGASGSTITAIAVASFGNWIGSYGLAGTNANFDADPDLDGRDNLYEYALGGDPTNQAVWGAEPVISGGAGGLNYVHLQRTDDSSLSYYLELTPDMANPSWTNTGYSVVGTNDIGAPFVEITNAVPVDVPAKFIKLVIEQL